VKRQNRLVQLKSKCSELYKLAIGREWILAILLAAGVVIVGLVIGLIGKTVIAVNQPHYIHYLLEPHNKLSFLANWDGVDYINISRHGYTSNFSTGWLPLYPILIFIVDKIINSSLMSALVIAWASLIGAIYYYQKIIKLFFRVTTNIKALKAVLFFILFPSGIYFIAAYTESLFAFLSLGAIYYALKKKYLPSALFVMLATATHITGIFVLVLVALILFEEKDRIRNIVITLCAGSLGLISYMTFLLIRYHNPFEFISAQRDHGWLHTTLLSRLSNLSAIDIIVAAALVLTVVYWWKRRKSFSIYSALYLLIPLVGGQFGGFPRYSLMAFPLPFMLYDYCRNKKLLSYGVLVVFFLCWTYILIRFVAGYVVS